VTMLSY